jgi:ketosteroid isomerase-like protein
MDNMKFYQIILATAATVFINACNSNESIDQRAEAEKLMELSRTWAKAAKKKDLENTLSYWGNDAIVMTPNQPAVMGKGSIRAMVERSMEIPGFEISWNPQEVHWC